MQLCIVPDQQFLELWLEFDFTRLSDLIFNLKLVFTRQQTVHLLSNGQIVSVASADSPVSVSLREEQHEGPGLQARGLLQTL